MMSRSRSACSTFLPMASAVEGQAGSGATSSNFAIVSLAIRHTCLLGVGLQWPVRRLVPNSDWRLSSLPQVTVERAPPSLGAGYDQQRVVQIDTKGIVEQQVAEVAPSGFDSSRRLARDIVGVQRSGAHTESTPNQ